MTKRWLFFLKLTISCLTLALIVTSMQVDMVLEHLIGVSYWLVILCVILFLFHGCLNAWRWFLILRVIGSPLPYPQTLKLIFIGRFFSQVMPSSIGGDVIRVFMAQRLGLKIPNAIGGVLLERTTALIGLFILAIMTLPFFFHRFDTPFNFWMLSAIVLSIAGAAIGFIFGRRFQKSHPDSWIFKRISFLLEYARKLFFAPGHRFVTVFLGVLANVVLIFGLYLLSLGLNMNVSFFECLMLFPAVLLASVLPISVSGWGVREGASIVSFGLIGVPSESALALSILFGLTIAVASLPGGVIWLFSKNARPSIT